MKYPQRKRIPRKLKKKIKKNQLEWNRKWFRYFLSCDPIDDYPITMSKLDDNYNIIKIKALN